MKIGVRVHCDCITSPSQFDFHGNLLSPATTGNMKSLTYSHLDWEHIDTPFISVFSIPEGTGNHTQEGFKEFERNKLYGWNRIERWIQRLRNLYGDNHDGIRVLYINLDKTLYVQSNHIQHKRRPEDPFETLVIGDINKEAILFNRQIDFNSKLFALSMGMLKFYWFFTNNLAIMEQIVGTMK